MHKRTAAVHIPLLLALLLPAGAVLAQQGSAPAQSLAAYAEQLLDEAGLKKDGPGVTLLVAQGDKLLYQGARGMASVELGVALKPEHQMRLGSITKQFASATLLKLIDDGKAALTDPLSKYLPDYPNGQAITLAQLLNHTSGVKSYTGIPGYMTNPIRSELSTVDLVKVFKDQPVDFAPGSQYAYNNSGYVLVGAVIEAISGKPWHETLDAALLKPRHIGVSYPAETRLIPGMVQGYSRGQAGELTAAGILSMTQPHAAGALVGDVQSLWRWNLALHGGQLLQPATYARMVQPEGAAALGRYGFGLGIDTVRGQPLIHHGGGIHGFSTMLMYQPTQKITVALLTNSDAGILNLDSLGRKLTAKAIGQPYPSVKPVSLSVDQLKAFEGVYGVEGKGTRTLRVVDGVLTSTRNGSRPIKLIPIGADRFQFDGSVAQAHLERSPQGLVLAYYAEGDGTADRWPRTGDVPVKQAVTLSPAQQQALVGDYASPQLSIKVFLDAQGRLLGQVPGQPALPLAANGPRELSVDAVGATLSFSAEPDQAQTLTLRQGPATIEMKRR